MSKMVKEYAYVVDIEGEVIPLTNIKRVSKKQFNTVEGMINKLSIDENTFSRYNSLYIMDIYNYVHVVDFDKDENRICYDGSYCVNIFLENFAESKKNTCISEEKDV